MTKEELETKIKESDTELLKNSVDGKLTIEQLAMAKTWIPIHMIPDNLKESFDNFMYGSTYAVINDIGYAYPNDIVRWIDKHTSK